MSLQANYMLIAHNASNFLYNKKRRKKDIQFLPSYILPAVIIIIIYRCAGYIKISISDVCSLLIL